MRFTNTAVYAESKLKKFFKSGVALLLAVLIVFATAFSLQQFAWKADAASNNSGQTAYKNISEFQKARWKEIQSSVFKGVNLGGNDAPLTPDQVINKELEPDNGYFNWTDTSLRTWGEELDYNKQHGIVVDANDVPISRYETNNYGGITANYTVYDVWTSEQLRYVLSSFESLSGQYIKINLISDLDMKGNIWEPVSLNFCKNSGYKKYLYFEGNGHTIYNLKIYNPDTNNYNASDNKYTGNRAAGLFSTPPAYMVWKNTGFMSSMVVNDEFGDACAQSALICAFLPQKAYFYNVHSSIAYFHNNDDGCSSAGGIGGLVGRKNIVANPGVDWSAQQMADCGDTFFENCSTEKQYMYGESHIGGFSSYMAPKSQSNNCSYDSEFPATPEQYVFNTSYLSGSGTANIINNSSSYPVMLKNCSSTDSVLFSVDHDSGAFISCGGGIYADSCFTNNTLYSSDNSGGFIGRVASIRAGNTSSSKDGFIKDANSNYTIGSVFRNCYSSGIIEGRVAMGGFVGLDNGRRVLNRIHEIANSALETSEDRNVRTTLYENCYSTAMVGMDYAGKYVGGFIGLDDNYNSYSEIVTHDGYRLNTKGNFYVNCYAAGEVGNVLTVTDTDERAKALEDEYFAKYEGIKLDDNTILDYYPTGGFIGALGIDNYRLKYANYSATGHFHNCYYDKQTTAMHEMEIGLSKAITLNGGSSKYYDIPGVEGYYTQRSDKKGVEGLTDMSWMDNADPISGSNVWQYLNEYYPQLKVFMSSDIAKSDLADVTSADITEEVENSEFYIPDSNNANEYSKPVLSLGGAKCTSNAQAQMAQVIRAYRESQASTSTVLLDHWDVTMDTQTGVTGNHDGTDWQISPENSLVQYYVDKDTGAKIGYVTYYDETGKTVPYASGAVKKVIKTSKGAILATLVANEDKYRDASGNQVDSVYDIPELSNTIDEWHKTYTGIDAGQYQMKIKEGHHSSMANTFGANGYNDTENIEVNVPYNNCDVTIRFHCDNISRTNYYVIAEYSNSTNSVTTELLAKSTAPTDTENGYVPRDLFVRGSFNEWGATDDSKLKYVGNVAEVGTLTYQCKVNLTAGEYEFKIANNDWTEEYSQANGSNMYIKLVADDEITFYFDDKYNAVKVVGAKNGSVVESHLNEPQTPSINFEGFSVIAPAVITGHDWLPTTSEQAILSACIDGKMTYNSETGYYEKTFTVNEYAFQDNNNSRFNKTYGYKIIENAVDSGANRYFYLADHASETDTTIEVTFHYNADTGDTYVTTDDHPDREDVPQIPHNMTYHVAGDKGLTGRDWLNDEYNESTGETTAYSNEGQMTYDGVSKEYIKTYSNIPAGKYEFKIVGNGTWDSGVSYGARNSNENYVLELAQDATVTIYFDVVSGIIQIVADPKDAILTKEYVVTGTGNLMGVSWDKQEAVMTFDEESGLHKYVINSVEQNKNYAFKVIEKNIDTGDNIPFRIEYNKPVNLLITYDAMLDKTELKAYDPDTGADVTDEAVKDVLIDHWSVLGDESLTGFNWGVDIYDQLPADEAGRMGKYIAKEDDLANNITKGDELWIKEYKNVAAPYNQEITYSFKVVANGLWDTGVSYGEGGLNGDNFRVNILCNDSTSEYFDLRIVFNATKGEAYYEVTPESYLTEIDKEWAVWVVYSEAGLTHSHSRNSNPLVYDTVRDITREFTFTAGEDSIQRGVTWSRNVGLNNSYGFYEELGFDLDYNVEGYDTNADFSSKVVELDVNSVSDTGYTGDLTMEASRHNLIARYTVSDFAPGKTWITVNTLGLGYSDDFTAWKLNTIKYDDYQNALNEFIKVQHTYFNVLIGFKYTVNGKTETVDSEDDVVPYCQFLLANGLSSNYDKLKESYGDVLALYENAENLKVENPGESPVAKNSTTGASTVAGQSIYGKRHLRLIPTVYLEAGVDTRISVIQADKVADEKDEQAAENVIRVDDNTSDGNVKLTNNSGNSRASTNIYDKYNFALSAGYLITDRIGLGIYTNYNDQEIVKYSNTLRDDLDVSQRIDNQYFAMSTVFTEDDSYVDNEMLVLDELTDQKAIGSAYTRGETKAQTMVQVYKQKKDKNGNVTLSKVVMDSTEGATGEYANNYQKWIGGNATFTSRDVGTYTVTFYWVMADGRYVEDSKEVVISAITSGLEKEVDINYTNEGDDIEITYTLTYVNDRSADALNYALFDVLPYNGDYRLGKGTPSIDKETKTTNDSLTLKSINVSQAGGSVVKGIYYSKSADIRNYTKENGTEVANAAEKLGMKNGYITNDTDKWSKVSTGDSSIADVYSNEIYTINEDAVTAIAVTGSELLPGQTLQIEYKILADMKIGDTLINNGYYDVVNVDGDIQKSDYSNHVFTTAVGRHIEGYAWLDNNCNSEIDADEPMFTNMLVSLYKKNDNGKYQFTGKTDVTGDDGKYKFTNLEEGAYIVVFDGPDKGDNLITDDNTVIPFKNLEIGKTLPEDPVADLEEGGYIGSQNIATERNEGVTFVDEKGNAIEKDMIFIPSKTLPTGSDLINDTYVPGVNTVVQNSEATVRNQNLALKIAKENSIKITKKSQSGELLSGVDFVIEKKEYVETVDENLNKVTEEVWYPVYFTERDGKLVQQNDNPKTYEELDANNQNIAKYAIVGEINGVETINGKLMIGNKVTITLEKESSIYLVSSDKQTKFFFENECTDKTGTLTKADSGERMIVPAGTHTFYVGEDAEGKLLLSYADNAKDLMSKKEEPAKLYLQATADWDKEGARFAAYFFDEAGSEPIWVTMNPEDRFHLYSVEIPDGSFTHVIFCRMNGSTTENDWANKWNQTHNAKLSDEYDLFTITDPWNTDNTGKWGKYSETYPPYENGKLTTDKYSLCGYIDGQDVGINNDFKNVPYVFVDGKLTVTFKSDSKVCVKTTDSEHWYWFYSYHNGNEGTLYKDVQDQKFQEKMFVPAGTVTFTLRENSDGTLSLSYEVNEAKYLFTTDEKGEINLDGLSSGSYRFKEVTAKSGYDKLKSAIYFDLPYTVSDMVIDENGNVVSTGNDDTFADLDSILDDDKVVSVKETKDADGKTVYEKRYSHVSFEVVDPVFQFTLPVTGNDGLFLAATAGVILLAAAIMLFVLSKKKREKASLKH